MPGRRIAGAVRVLYMTLKGTLRASRRPHKYGAKPKTVDGIRFASQKEARRYQELRLLEKAGEIVQLRCQVPMLLSVGRAFVGGQAALGKYVADFVYGVPCGTYRGEMGETLTKHTQVVEDVKGFKTPLYRWKKKHVEAQYGITIHEI